MLGVNTHHHCSRLMFDQTARSALRLAPTVDTAVRGWGATEEFTNRKRVFLLQR